MENIISIIIPVYNVRQYLDQCLNSLAEQTYKNLEIILVDDGSTDGSSEICDSYSEKDERFKVIHQNNAGVSAARNAGLNAISGEWIMFMDADDWIENDACETALNCANRNDADAVLFNMIYEYVDKSEVCCAYNEEFRIFEKKNISTLQCNILFPALPDKKAVLSVIAPFCKLYRREKIMGCSFQLDVRYGEDAVFNLYALENMKKAVFMKKPLYHYRIRKGSACNKFDPEQINQIRTQENYFTEFIALRHSSENDFTSALKKYYARRIVEMCSYYFKYKHNYKTGKVKITDFISQEPFKSALYDKQLFSILGKKQKAIIFLLRMHCYLIISMLAKINKTAKGYRLYE